MFIIATKDGETDYKFWGPFQTEDRAFEYAKSFNGELDYQIFPIIVPNCIGVTFTTRY